MRALLLRLDAPLMSFGGVIVDQHGFTESFPTKSMLTGLCANALGYERRDAERHQDLQGRLEYAARQDREPERMEDYHTVDLGQPHLLDRSWTTRGAPEERRGGAEARRGTHIRYRHYLADGVYTVALTLRGADTTPTLDELAQALCVPARPLSLGRRPCVPSAPVLLGERQGPDLLAILGIEPLCRPRPERAHRARAWWPTRAGLRRGEREVEVCDERDWLNQVHVGRRTVYEGWLEVGGTP
ncbi:MAG: type I-E CRISPR-associated protein Cas5/CasD [Sandaracinaceae bacterium]